MDIPDEFYDLTPEDFAVMQHQQQQRKKVSGATRRQWVQSASLGVVLLLSIRPITTPSLNPSG
jgi:hypothetical protein